MQRPSGGNEGVGFEEHQGSQCGWSRDSEAENTGTERTAGM